MNAARTHQNGQQATNMAKGRQPYQPSSAIALRGCNCLVYKTQTLDWELDKTKGTHRGAASEPDVSKYSLRLIPICASAYTRLINARVPGQADPFPPPTPPVPIWGLRSIFPHFSVDFVD